MDHPHPVAAPHPDRAKLKLQDLDVSSTPQSAVGPPDVRTELDRYNIAVVVKAIYEWGGYRYTNAIDAIAAAKRASK